MSDNGLISRMIESEPPAANIIRLCVIAGAGRRLLWQTGELCFVLSMKMPAIGGVLDILIKIRLHGGELLHQFPEPLFFAIRQGDAGQTKIP